MDGNEYKQNWSTSLRYSRIEHQKWLRISATALARRRARVIPNMLGLGLGLGFGFGFWFVFEY